MIGKMRQRLSSVVRGEKAQKVVGFVKTYGPMTALNLAAVVGVVLLSPMTVLADSGLSWGNIYEQAKIIGGFLAALGLVGVALRRLGGPIAEAVPFLASDQFIISAFIGAIILLNVTSIVSFMGLPAPGS